MQIRNLPTIKSEYGTDYGAGLWVVPLNMSDANIIDLFDDTLYDAVAREVDWVFIVKTTELFPLIKNPNNQKASLVVEMTHGVGKTGLVRKMELKIVKTLGSVRKSVNNENI
jgi:hypothetical protein